MRMSSGHGQPLLKTGWEADECLQDVGPIVCMVFGENIPDPLLSSAIVDVRAQGWAEPVG